MDITEFNAEALSIHTPLSYQQSLKILMLIDKGNSGLMNKIIDEAVSFEPVDTYFDRLKQSLAEGTINSMRSG